MENVLDKQVGGNHYKKYSYQPITFMADVHLHPTLAYVLKYVARYPDKNPDDIQKAVHCLELYRDWFNSTRNKLMDKQPNALDEWITPHIVEANTKNLIKFSHQFEPVKAMLIQRIVKLTFLQDYMDSEGFDIAQYLSDIDDLIDDVGYYETRTQRT